jgi:hypothetical protein
MANARLERAQRKRRVAWKVATVGDRDLPLEELYPSAQIDRGRRFAAPSLRPEALEQLDPTTRRRPSGHVEDLHQPFRCASSVVAVPHGNGERLLIFEAQAIHLSARARVKSVAQAPKELFGLGHLLRLSADENPELHELAPNSELGPASIVGE